MRTSQRLDFDPIAEAHRQWSARDWGEPDAMAAATSVMRAQQLVLQRTDAVLAPFALTFARYEVLALLRLSRAGSLPLGKIGVRLMVHPASVTNAVDRLAAAGLVARQPHPTDRRATLAAITPAGRSTAEAATTALVRVRFGLDALTDAQCRQLTATVERLRRNVDFDA